MTAQAPVLREHGNSYNIFILVLTIFSLAIMVAGQRTEIAGAACHARRRRELTNLAVRHRPMPGGIPCG